MTDGVASGAARTIGDDRNVVVLLTPPGSAAIAVIRLHGPLNATFADRHLTRPPRRGVCVYCDVRDGDDVLDDAVVVLTDHGHLDLNIHGGPWVTQAVLQLAERVGYALVGWREAVDVATDAGDEIERQMLLDLPAAKSGTILRHLLAQPRAWRAMLATQDVDAMRNALADTTLQRALAIPTVAIVGLPNVGKSTLANALFGQERSITADRPGTTRDWVGELADVDGLIVQLIDTPGVRETGDAVEAEAIRQAGSVIADADLVLVAVDGSSPLEPASADLINRLKTQVPLIVVRTKNDLPARCALMQNAIDLSAACGDGMDDLRVRIHERLGVLDLVGTNARCWTEAQRYKLRSLLKAADASI